MVFRKDINIASLWDVPRLSESVKKHSPAAHDFLGFPKVSQHPARIDDAILHRKPFGIPLIICYKCMII